ncbi:MAG: ACP S-malonyltransferase [Lentisphaeria bacterium]|jgi:[acyl-carrier-protein] S-malonyltransferase|nr:ACP S-malonyltransferase [Lentisphaeria bacterium]
MSTRLGFMFAGQGAQFPGMGRDLPAVSPAAAAVFEQADSLLGRSLSALCFGDDAAALTASANCQPAIFTVSLACAAAFRERTGLAPAVCGGLSLGELTALAAAGAYDFATGLRLVARRGELMDQACAASQGAMAAVIGGEPAVIERICGETGIDVANYNCPGQIVVSGPAERMDAASERLAAAGARSVVRLNVAGAFHSRLMQPAADAFAPVLEATAITVPACPVAQNVAGALVTDSAELRRNLARQVTGSVHWETCVRAMLATGIQALVEFGPGKVLAGFMRRIDRSFPVCSIQGAEDLAAAEKLLESL